MEAVSFDPDKDFYNYQETITFEVDEDSKIVTIQVSNDDELELTPETFKVGLSGVVNGHIEGATEAVVTLYDDECEYLMHLCW